MTKIEEKNNEDLFCSFCKTKTWQVTSYYVNLEKFMLCDSCLEKQNKRKER